VPTMRYTTLPGTELRVSVIAMGSWALAGDMAWGDQSEKDSIAATRAAVDAGITFFDTAPGYGDGLSEQRLGKGLTGLRDKVVVATKIGPDAMRGDAVRASVERSLGHLGTDYVDLIQIHWPSREVPIEETLEALEALKSQGKVRVIGISNFGPIDLAGALKVATPTTNQLPYSLLSRAIEYEIVPACARAGVGILCYSPLLWGLLAGTYQSAEDVPDGRARSRHFSPARKLIRHKEPGCEQETFQALRDIRAVAERLGVPMSDLAVAWLLHQPGVTGVLTGIRRPEQAGANAKAADLELDTATLAELDRVTQPVKRALGNNPDLWQSGENSRFR
jgi:aryl-alcohol dehydrogenase-like predicted oxidoreductase